MGSEIFFFYWIINSIIKKYLHFGILVYSNGIMYSMDNIEIENTLSIKQIFDFFPSLYFESQGNTNNRKLIPTKFFILSNISMNRLLPKWYMDNEEPRNPFLYFFIYFFIPPLFFSKRKEIRFLLVIKRRYTLSIGNKIDIVVV